MYLQQVLGLGSRYPHWAIAFKFAAETAVTKLISIECQVGRTGRVVPVAVLEPVRILGATISRASLHNFSQLERLELRVGDTVEIERRGDVIPHVKRVVQHSTQPYHMDPALLICPCEKKSPLARQQGDVDAYCTEKSCPEQLVQR